jgi:hypothetical protein
MSSHHGGKRRGFIRRVVAVQAVTTSKDTSSSDTSSDTTDDTTRS